MLSAICCWITRRLPVKPSRPARHRNTLKFQPSLETLESRLVPTVMYQGGGVLPHVEVQALYLGSAWNSNSASVQQVRYLEGYLNSIVNSSYMDMLTNAGYGVYRGSFTPGKIDLTSFNSAYYLTDDMIRNYLEADIHNGALQAPDSNRLYVVFVEPGVAVMDGSGATSKAKFLGFHNAFAGTDAYGNAATIHYAMVDYPGGVVGNTGIPWLAPLNELTQVASHELAEAVTDPNPSSGWDDHQLEFGEVGDIANGRTVWLNGYAVQRIAIRTTRR